jgi:hypothetical protein
LLVKNNGVCFRTAVLLQWYVFASVFLVSM